MFAKNFMKILYTKLERKTEIRNHIAGIENEEDINHQTTLLKLRIAGTFKAIFNIEKCKYVF